MVILQPLIVRALVERKQNIDQVVRNKGQSYNIVFTKSPTTTTHTHTIYTHNTHVHVSFDGDTNHLNGCHGTIISCRNRTDPLYQCIIVNDLTKHGMCRFCGWIEPIQKGIICVRVLCVCVCVCISTAREREKEKKCMRYPCKK
jgi:hypothetical protein